MVQASNVYFFLLTAKFATLMYFYEHDLYRLKEYDPFLPRVIRPLQDRTNDRWAKKKLAAESL